MATSLSPLITRPHPLIQAPMAGVQGSKLALAVHRAGGLGSLPAAMLGLDQLAAELDTLRAGSGVAVDEPLPFNINFFCHTPPTPDAQAELRWRTRLLPFAQELGVEVLKAPAGAGRSPFSAEAATLLERHRPRVLSFHFGLPAPDLLARVKSWGAVVMSSATTVDEARWLVQHGADAVIAQGLEAGGHRGHFLSDDLSRQMGTFALLPQVVAALPGVPVVAAGGIGDVSGIRAALALGAAGVQIGTSYLLCDEASTSGLHRAALRSDRAAHTALTTVFTGRPARGIVNRLMRELGPLSTDAPAFPLATAAIAPLRAAAEAQGSAAFSPLWAGQNTRGCQAVSAEDLTRQLLGGFDPL